MENNRISHGYIEPKSSPKDLIFGSTDVPGEVLQVGGHGWGSFLGRDEVQNAYVESYNCTGYGTNHAVQALFKRLFGQTVDWSDRALGINAGTFPPGNDPATVGEAFRKKGPIDEVLFPYSPDINTVEKYYSPRPFPPELLTKGLEWLKDYRFWYERVSPATPEAMINALQFSPLGAAVYAWAKNDQGQYVRLGTDCHWTEIYDYIPNVCWYVFDSYDNTHKQLVWDFGFTTVFRYHIEKLPPPTPVAEKVSFIRQALFYLYQLLIKQAPQTSVPLPQHVSRIPDWAEAAKVFEGWTVGSIVNGVRTGGSPSWRNCNPGNLKFRNSLGNRVWKDASGEDIKGFAVFPTEELGKKALCTLLTNACTGKSKVYSPEMDLVAFYKLYSEDNQVAYAEAVAKTLNVPTSTKIKELV